MDTRNASPLANAQCKFCAGRGLIKTQKGEVKCIKCGGSGRSPKMQTK